MLSRKEYSRHRLNQKLIQRHCPEKIREQVLNECIEQGWLNDERFALMIVRAKSQAGYGAKYIQQYLFQHQINLDVDVLAEEAEVDWYAVLTDLVERKYKSKNCQDYKERQKRFRFLFSRGFSPDLINQVLKNAADY